MGRPDEAPQRLKAVWFMSKLVQRSLPAALSAVLTYQIPTKIVLKSAAIPAVSDKRDRNGN
jgi:hypothetical protein